jgi:triosephosphate isomerase
MEERMRELDREMFSVVMCPPFVFLEDVARRLGDGVLAEAAVLGAQDIAARDDAAQTGEVSGPQLAQLGARYVIVGHSERRYKLGETDEMVNEKLKAALRNGLVPLVCIGERKRTGAWQDELALQIAETFRGLTPGQVGQCVIAYEPVWAISTNPDAQADTPASAVLSMNLIREALADQFNVSHHAFLYGGSVTPDNAEAFLSRHEISGVLIGGASVRADDFCAILSIAAQQQT